MAGGVLPLLAFRFGEADGLRGELMPCNQSSCPFVLIGEAPLDDAALPGLALGFRRRGLCARALALADRLFDCLAPGR